MQKFGDFRKFHFIGIGGIGMSGIAEILLQSGYTVSGSDLQESPTLERLRKQGARIFVGHREHHLGDAEAVIFSSAVPAENPELKAAQAKALPILHRAEMLAELMRNKTAITVAGTHGKTTTSAMISVLLHTAGLDPTVVVGGKLKIFGSGARLGRGAYLVAEADESDRSFLKLFPIHTVVTNVDLDHLDQYTDLADIQQAFLDYMNKVPFYGAVVACADDLNLRPLLKNVHRRMITYALEQEADISARRVQLGSMRSSCECMYRGEILGHIELAVPGRHNVQNSLAVVAVGLLLEIPFNVISRALRAFEGAERRMEWKGERGGVWVLDDYGHHPAEIRATLEACRATGRRMVVVFQPHRYTRTLHLIKELGASFENADCLYLMDVYSAGEEPIAEATSERLAGEIRRYRPVNHVPDREKLMQSLENETRAGDLLLTLGAGDVWKIGETFLAKHTEAKA